MSTNLNRRSFLKKTSTAVASAAILTNAYGPAIGQNSPTERPRIGVIGCGSRWGWLLATNYGPWGCGPEFARWGDYVAVCDADTERVEGAKRMAKKWNNIDAFGSVDYRDIIERDDVDVVICFTPEHWHAKVAIEAMLAGKDVYCEKPLTLTIEEGQQISEVVKSTGRIMQVGTQQRSDIAFHKALGIIKDGRLGELKRIEIGIGGAPTSPEIPVAESPKTLDWDRWLGPTPKVEYRALPGHRNETKEWSRCHYEFRWWYEYSGGKLTDWGAHHVDIATWAMGKTNTGPVAVDPVMVQHPVPFEDGNPTIDNRYNTATAFEFDIKYEDGPEVVVKHNARNGLLIEGTEGRIFVTRGRLTGAPAEELADKPLPDGMIQEVFKGRERINGSAQAIHVESFFQAVRDRKEPISDVHSHHRALSTCHLMGIAARLGRKIQWDPAAEKVIGDEQAQSFVGRKKREGYEIEMG